MLDKTYQPQQIEGSIYRAWEEANARYSAVLQQMGH